MKRFFIGFVSIIIFLVSTTTSFATDSLLGPKGDAEFSTSVQPLSVQFEDLLRNSTTSSERTIILKKAANMGISSDDLSNAQLSAEETAILNGGMNINKNNTIDINKAIVVSPTPNTRVVVAGVSMPDYALWPTIYKQTTSTYCSAATIYTASKYIGANPPSQASIMNFWQSQWGVTYPDLYYMRNYMNLHLPGKPSDYVPYVRRNYAGSQTTFNTDLKNNVLNYQPMILHMKNSTGTTNWPYTTSGHFCICSGLLTWENNKYFIGDPYYFSQYVSSATANNGEHKRTWTQLNTVITNKFGANNQAYVT
ncbi:MAG: hypothetical protein MJ168_08405 [Clostridia bacterium]|nr:hypothetical protein [Clostridia bacterium]